MRARAIRYLFLLLITVVTVFQSFAQDASRIYIEPSGWSIGTNFGLSDLWGDVGTKTVIDHYTNSKYFDKVAFLGGMFGRYTIHPCLGIKFGLNYGTLYATDAWNYDKAVVQGIQGSDAYQRYARNQRARTNIFESYGVFELTPFRFNPEQKRAYKKGQPYIGIGLGYFHFQPQSTVANGNKFINIYDLHIEGDGFGDGYPKAYSLWQFNIPMSVGYRWDLGMHLNIGVEFVYRKTFTDYLDGVSGKYIDPKVYALHLSPADALTAAAVEDKAYLNKLAQPNVAGNIRGNSANKDAYSTLSFTLYYKVFARTKQWWNQY